MPFLTVLLHTLQPIATTALGAGGAMLLIASVPGSRLMMWRGVLPASLASVLVGFPIAGLGMLFFATAAPPQSAATAVAIAVVGVALFAVSLALDEISFESGSYR